MAALGEIHHVSFYIFPAKKARLPGQCQKNCQKICRIFEIFQYRGSIRQNPPATP